MEQIRNKSNGMGRHIRMLAILLVPVIALILGAAAPQVWAGGHRWRVPFAETEVFFEFNSTDLDLGIQIFFDAEAWEEVWVKGPDYCTIFNVKNGGSLSDIGSTEVFTESAEPELDEANLDEEIEAFLAKFPEGRYRFRGRTVDGKRLRGAARLTWDLPAPPEIVLPEEDGEPADIAFIDWIPGEDGPDIVGYEVVAEIVANVLDEEQVYVNTATLPADITQFRVSPEFVQLAEALEDAGNLVEAKVEVIAREASGNKTITEVVVFEVEED